MDIVADALLSFAVLEDFGIGVSTFLLVSDQRDPDGSRQQQCVDRYTERHKGDQQTDTEEDQLGCCHAAQSTTPHGSASTHTQGLKGYALGFLVLSFGF